jgi:hypothetical protein
VEQVHKRRDVLDQLPDEHQPGIERNLLAAYAMVGEAAAPSTTSNCFSGPGILLSKIPEMIIHEFVGPRQSVSCEHR